jgi:ABC-type nitrate/sulfonate/bicarbonate transport system permease component
MAATTRTWRSRLRGHLLGLVAVCALLGIWEGTAYWIGATHEYGSSLLPTIQYVAKHSFPQIAGFTGEALSSTTKPSYWGAVGVLLTQSKFTLVRLLLGTAMGVLLGVLVGSIMAVSRSGRAVIAPPVLVARNIPPLALVPLFVLWFGDSELGRVIYVAFVVFSMIVVSTVHAIENLDPVWIQYARTLGADRRKIFTSVLLPAALPEVAAGLKVVIGLSWAIVLAAEFIAAHNGLGSLLIIGETFFDVGLMIVVVIVFVLYSLIMNAAFDALTRYLARGMPQSGVE